MPNLKKQEQQHQETVAALALTSQKSNVIINNNSDKDDLLPSAPDKNFRLDAIKNLKATGKPFDEFDVELEVEKLKEEYAEQLAEEEKIRQEEELKLLEKRKQEEQVRIEEKKRIEKEKRKKEQPYLIAAIFLPLVLLLIYLFFILRPSLFSGSKNNLAVSEEGVVINGVRWATRNVGAPGTFAENPESAGMFFQWNRRQGWSTISGNASGWNDSMPTGTMWQSANNPCPPGWRIPTAAEFQSLNNSGSTWTTRNGVSGRLFGREPNQLFLPATGWRVSSSGALNGVGSGGVYWSSTLYHNENTHAMRFGIYQQYTNLEARNHAHGFSVRCVADETTSSTPQQPATQAAISTSLDGVAIDGVRWATRNVAAPGTFAESPESFGMFYQWNRRQGWATTGATVSGWNAALPSGTSWTRANDPCPSGWRVPTESELRSLMNAGSTWTTRNGVIGRLFGSAPNQLFLPAAGWRGGDFGCLVDAGETGRYWSRTQGSGRFAIAAGFFGGDDVFISPLLQLTGSSIRCVAEN